MPHLLALTPLQASALGKWAEGPADAPILLDMDGIELLAGQGDARCRIYPDGTTVDEA